MGAATVPDAAEAATPTVEGSKDARRQAVLVLELLTGLRSPSETCEALGCSSTRVYQLETRALQAVITAMEPRPRGPQPNLERRIAELERDKEALADELQRTQALLRAAYRSFGVPASAAPGGGSKPASRTRASKRRKKPARARKAIARAVAVDESETTPTRGKSS
jgi:hypothetical protein